MMRKFLGVALFVGLVSFMAAAQETPKAEVFGGYQFTHLEPSTNANGWNGAVNYYFNNWLGVTGDFSGAYKSGGSLTTFAGGPVISSHKGKVAPFAHALFGGGHFSASGFGNTAFTMMFGGGVDLGDQKFAFRLAQVDWMMFHDNGVTSSKNVRVSTGLMLRF
jgi:hypothetical protein